MSNSYFRVGSACALSVLTAGTAFAQITTINSQFPLGWTDRVGGLHVAAGINIDWYDDDSIFFEGSSLQYLGLSRTNAAGNTTFITNEDDYGSEIEFVAYVRAEVRNVANTQTIAVMKENFGDPSPYLLRDPRPTGYYPVTEGATTPVPAFDILNNTTFVGTSMTALQTIRFMNNYYTSAPFNAALPNIEISYKAANAGSSMGHSQMTLGYTAWANVDVILHEYGHHVAEFNNLDYRDVNGNGYGLDHYFANDNISGNNAGTNYNPTVGSRLAWQEGIATYVGMAAIHHGNLAAAIPGMPADDYDLWYDNYSPDAHATNVPPSEKGFGVNIETRQFVTRTNTTVTSGMHNVRIQGEGNESSVMRVAWDLRDAANDGFSHAGHSDRANLGTTKVYDLAKTSDTFYDFWKRTTADVLADKSQVGLPAAAPMRQVLATLGELLQEYGIAGNPLTEGIVLHTDSLNFEEQNNSNSRRHSVYVMDVHWNYVSDFEFADPNLATLNQWNIPLNNPAYFPANTFVPGQTYRWAVLSTAAIEGNVAPALLREWYWSGVNTFTYVPEPSMGLFLILGAAGLRRRRA